MTHSPDGDDVTQARNGGGDGEEAPSNSDDEEPSVSGLQVILLLIAGVVLSLVLSQFLFSVTGNINNESTPTPTPAPEYTVSTLQEHNASVIETVAITQEGEELIVRFNDPFNNTAARVYYLHEGERDGLRLNPGQARAELLIGALFEGVDGVYTVVVLDGSGDLIDAHRVRVQKRGDSS